MEDGNLNFYSLLLIAGLAFLIPLAVNGIKAVRIPVVIAEIAAGIIVGKSGFNIVQNDVWIEFLSQFGFAYLMFLSGVEIDFAYFKRAGRRRGGHANPLVLGVVLFLLTVALSYFASNVLVRWGMAKNALLLTLIFSTTSLGIVVPILKERRIINEPVGQVVLMSALIADFASMLAIPAVMYFTSASQSGSLLTSLAVFAAFALVYFLGKKFFKFDLNNPTFETSQIKVRAAFALVLIFVTISKIFNVEIILGAFLAGILFSLLFSEFRTEIAPKLDAIGYGFLIPIFFIMIGAHLDLRSVFKLEALIALPVFLAVVYAVKLIPSLVLKIFFPWRETLGAGFLISSRLSLIIAISVVALEAGIITDTIYSTFVLVAIFTCLVSPIVFSRIFPVYKAKKEGIVIAGGSEIVVSLARRLAGTEKTVILADTGERMRERLDALSAEFTYWADFNEEPVRALKDVSVGTMVAAYAENEKNIEACEKARRAGVRNVIALIDDPKVSHSLEKEGVKTVTPMKAMHTLLNAFIRHPESFEVLYGPEDGDSIDVREMRVLSPGVAGLKLRELRLPGDCLVLMISRDERRIVPDGATELMRGDVVVIIGSKEYNDELEAVFS